MRKLSSREREVLKLVASGLTSVQIACELYLSKRTVENHRINIRKKLLAKNTVCMVKKAVEERLI
ncbi:response regulator transcription factor [Filimonas lacunae]|uniref:response regulator transcription factor n=1 Tax=Filimonas lacunae TaxID=477680 RepID=UPI0013565602|nr:helix-turn-helix transcriptional regulator [Filimonas lacunae]